MAGNRSHRMAVVFFVSALGIYGVGFAAMLAFARHGINPDGVAYLRIARYYAEGRFDYAVNSYWGPLLSWLLAPAFWINADPLLVAKLYGGLLGVLLAGGAVRFLRSLGDTGGGAGVFAAALFFAAPCAMYVTPDLLLSAIVVWYLVFAARLLEAPTKRDGLLAGLAGGLAYLAKSYALPFVLAHLALTAGLRLLRVRAGRAQGFAAGPFSLAVVGFFLLAAPWIVIISLHDGRPTIGSAGRIGHAWTMDAELAQRGLPIYDLNRPREGRVTGWENPVEIRAEWPVWSPFDGVRGMAKQVKYSVLNGYRILRYFHQSTFGVVYVAGALALLSLFPLGRAVASRRLSMRLWGILSLGLYCGGYALVLVKPRYIWPIMGPLMALSVQTFGSFFEEDAGASAARHPLRRMLAIVLVATMAFQLALEFKWATESDSHYALESRIHEVCDGMDLKGPAASNRWDMGLYVSYWKDMAYLGGYHGETADRVAAELAPYGRVDVLVFSDERLADSMMTHPAFRLKQKVSGETPARRFWLFDFTPAPTP